MFIRILYLLFITLFFPSLSQEKQFAVTNGNSLKYRNKIYCYGLSENSSKTVLHIFILNDKLEKTDSTDIPIRGQTQSYLQLSADTLHDFLNIYLHSKEKKKVTIIRLDGLLKQVTLLEDVEAARLNNSLMFNEGALFQNNSVFDVKEVPGDSGQQFYLNRYNLKSTTVNFDYELKWQFAFEKKSIQFAKVFYADKRKVFIYVIVGDGKNKGEWVLMINASTGTLIRGTKLNNKGEKDNLIFGNFLFDKITRNLLIFGQKIPSEKTTNGKTGTTGSLVSLFLVEIDTVGEKVNKQEFNVPVNSINKKPKVVGKKLARITKVVKDIKGLIKLEIDLYEKNGVCYRYIHSTMQKLSASEGKLIPEKIDPIVNTLVEQFYTTLDVNDRNGTICPDSAESLSSLFFKTIPLPVKMGFKMDESGNPFWLLRKSNIKKATTSYAFIKPEKKIYKIVNIGETPKSQNPQLYFLTDDKFVFSSMNDENKLVLKIISW